MYILGISAFYHDSAACLLKDDRPIAAAQEERFTRIKNDASFPMEAIKYCLKEAGIDMLSVDHVVYYEKPFLKFERLVETFFAFAPRGLTAYLRIVPLWVKEKLFTRRRIIKLLRALVQDGEYPGENLLFTTHHEAHAASAYFPSPYSDAVILTMDGVGEWATTTISIANDNNINTVKCINFPHSIGLLYSAFTYFLGFKVNCDEYKVMGLAPYGTPRFEELICDQLIDIKNDGSFRLNMNFFSYATGLTMTNSKFARLFKAPRRKPDEEISAFHKDIAASIQKVTERLVLNIASYAHTLHPAENLCLAGGVALNCVANGRLAKEGPFKNIWVQPAAGDAGGALGAAYWVYYNEFKNKRSACGEDAMAGALLGPQYAHDEIVKVLADNNIEYNAYSRTEFIDSIARSIANGKVVGWFNGRMEFGPRALGSRSILADPRRADMQHLLNHKIKFRESFRPFAPAILEQYANEYFNLKQPSPYMLFTAQVKSAHITLTDTEPDNLIQSLKNIPTTIPAVTHVDLSARVQTVNGSNGLFFALLTRFHELTGCPLLINTSFNVMDEPIVCTPEDALRCFGLSGIDILAFPDIIITKP